MTFTVRLGKATDRFLDCLDTSLPTSPVFLFGVLLVMEVVTANLYMLGNVQPTWSQVALVDGLAALLAVSYHFRGSILQWWNDRTLPGRTLGGSGLNVVSIIGVAALLAVLFGAPPR